MQVSQHTTLSTDARLAVVPTKDIGLSATSRNSIWTENWQKHTAINYQSWSSENDSLLSKAFCTANNDKHKLSQCRKGLKPARSPSSNSSFSVQMALRPWGNVVYVPVTRYSLQSLSSNGNCCFWLTLDLKVLGLIGSFGSFLPICIARLAQTWHTSNWIRAHNSVNSHFTIAWRDDTVNPRCNRPNATFVVLDTLARAV